MQKTNKVIIQVLIIFLVAGSLLILPRMTGFASKEINQSNEPKTATFAVCEQKGEYSYCKDKIFASCNKEAIEINDSYFYCNGKRYEINNTPLGETYINNETDKREQNLITTWATSN